MYKLILVLTFAIFLGGCAEVGQQIRKTSCTYELDHGWIMYQFKNHDLNVISYMNMFVSVPL